MEIKNIVKLLVIALIIFAGIKGITGAADALNSANSYNQSINRAFEQTETSSVINNAIENL